MFEINNYSRQRVIKLAVIIFIGCFIVLCFASFDMIKSRMRDTERRSDIKTLAKALELYHDKYDRYPDSVDDGQGWDLSTNEKNGVPDFLTVLKTEGFINRTVSDPVNDIFYNYRYRKYAAGELGCQTSFYILQISGFESPAEDNGRGECPEFDWTQTNQNGYTIQGFD